MRVLFHFDASAEGIPTSTGYYRSVLPAKALEKLGHEAPLTQSINIKCSADGTKIEVLEIEEDADVIVWQRPLDRITPLIMAVPSKGLKVVEVDDDFIHLQNWSPLLTQYKQQNFEPLRRFEDCLRKADLITVTTPELAELYSDYCDNIKVLPNHIELLVWEKVRQERKGNLKIGWAGWTHGEDLDVLKGVVDRIVTKRGVEFHLAGWPEAVEKFKCEVYTYPWQPIDDYRKIVGSFDIGLAPLKEETFNFGKSWLKALEYMAAGVVPIASKWHPDYSRLIKHGVNGFLADTKKEWRECIEALLDDSNLLARMRKNALKTAVKWDNESHAGKLWKMAYAKGLKRK
jgi:glycosyltransferase involved in cell wall biosynthesis